MLYDTLATRLTAEYDLFLYALSGRYQQMRAPGVTATPRAIADLNYKAHELASTFYQIASNEIATYIDPMIEAASESVADRLTQRKIAVLTLITSMLLENVHQVIKTARTGITGPGDMLKGSTGAIGSLLQRMMAKITFKANDTSGRKWDAEKLFRVIVRDFAYQSWLDQQVEQLDEAGVTLITNNQNAVFPISEFENVRAQYFHINSNAIPTPYVPS